MPVRPASVESKRQSGHLKDSLGKQGKSEVRADQPAAQTADRRRNRMDRRCNVRSDGDASRESAEAQPRKR